METVLKKKISDPHKIANMFNEYFVNVGPNSDKMYNHYLTGSYKNSFFSRLLQNMNYKLKLKT